MCHHYVFHSKLTFFDIAFITTYAYAFFDVLRNWPVYTECQLPIRAYLISSMLTLLCIKVFQLYNNYLAHPRDPQNAEEKLDWRRMDRLKCQSLIVVCGLLPLFLLLNFWGTAMFFMLINYEMC